MRCVAPADESAIEQVGEQVQKAYHCAGVTFLSQERAWYTLGRDNNDEKPIFALIALALILLWRCGHAF